VELRGTLIAVPLRIHLLSLIGAAMILTIMVTQPVLPLYLKDRGLPASEVGLVVGLMSLSLIVTELGAMAVSRRVGRRRAILLGTLGSAAMQLWFAFAATRPEWYLSRLLFGAFRGVLWPILFAEVADATPEGRHGRAFAMFWLYFGVGLLVGPAMGGWIADALGLRAPLLLAGALALLPLGFARTISTRHDAPVSVTAAFLALARQREVSTLWLLNAAHTTVYGLFATFLPLYAEAQGLVPSQIGWIFAAGSAAFTLAQVPAGRILDRAPPLAILLPAFLARGATTAMVPLVSGFGGLLALNAILGAVGAVVPSALTSRLAVAGQRGHAVAAMGGFNASADVGFFVGPTIGGLLAGYNLAWPFLMALPVSVVAASLLWTLHPREPLAADALTGIAQSDPDDPSPDD
jgi:MFS family permease